MVRERQRHAKSAFSDLPGQIRLSNLHVSSRPILQFISLQGVILIVVFCGMPILVSAIKGSRDGDHGEYGKATRRVSCQMTITIHIFLTAVQCVFDH